MAKILGIDVGGTKVASGIVTDGLNVENLEINKTSQVDLVGQLQDIIRDKGSFDAIGLAMPGPVLADGTVMRLPNVPQFQKSNIKQILENQFHIPVAVMNDAKAFALAESIVGQGKGHNVVAAAVLGTGIGVGIVINKQIYFGKDGVAGELEHVQLLDGMLFREHRHAAGPFVKAIDAKKYLKTLLDMIVLSFNPDIIVLSGGWSTLPGMEEMANELTKGAGNYESQTPVKISELMYPSLIGAALMAEQGLPAGRQA
ncbi:MAG: hypothetical protein A3I07_03820 [Candidatus Doudnabacteria bacterium RIFCSPLOWO2_02_FULL_42_9]|uniref:ROK family protein n=1 Tax=Candidatus Doudnabacteria bacterium RIFCSPHIGHO2_01_FULL_41_86 TaxID=1817821 RepID=A0A1F5N8K5_9BACT|nr:MAG: hypothetical protein A2717_00490 [Candidatus Doudnabacteria bacterium RIFCSPHIGHO2_01_FULL_41_86]OGE75153.1 MAG: hypothetical protein A3K07_01560 [Candidatus Doudnabacteria bacterium RIFCSPHIGHO2_01_43_10]OGE86422.1 MAG: hypothetical protein A3E28_00365 [Candidatus Doudnabacteria bacterium RIFCSPHIGHO2_12_FULL_42_22]OGE87421.1 MAG: hypothetical protein A3C49_04350 [Candidatus Doudnabacteria bacterium RIFCSPHIGHO2_02_FULL_42_25]OGE92719.1 MAG: hypothetical protein A2895_03845 [Candidatus